ncbi:MAG: hypothetical protein GTO30_12150, partial [Acidobacteria bacterium]|nr:hypothetical protein [Acidobacteriota bacterium]NIM62379.1 hypothetical protein [Acidobacteriota bacterium]NIO60688.1 hypothetical protein [Acidobacteriota bacterium]NIQ87059.1 hypothetical protein [Acidobacteriota bacterium]NIT10439.1 hypothetical protein [Acidobacteriota bacterium]
MTVPDGKPAYRSSSDLGTMAALAILATAGLNAVVSLVNGHGASTFAT